MDKPTREEYQMVADLLGIIISWPCGTPVILRDADGMARQKVWDPLINDGDAWRLGIAYSHYISTTTDIGEGNADLIDPLIDAITKALEKGDSKAARHALWNLVLQTAKAVKEGV